MKAGERDGSVWVRVVWGSVIALAALVLRLLGLRYGLPAIYNPDEVAIMSRALAFAKGDLNPHNFLYPSLYFYVLFAWEGLTALAAVAIGNEAEIAAAHAVLKAHASQLFSVSFAVSWVPHWRANVSNAISSAAWRTST